MRSGSGYGGGFATLISDLITNGFKFILFVIALIAVIWWWDSRSEHVIPKDQIAFAASTDYLGMRQDDQDFTVRVVARIENNSQYNLQTVDYVVSMLDCPINSTVDSQCKVLQKVPGQLTPYIDPGLTSMPNSLSHFYNAPAAYGERVFRVEWSNPIGDTDLTIPKS